jgi:hypothetical protein
MAHLFFPVPRSVSKLAASSQALITLGSPSPHPTHLTSLVSKVCVFSDIIAVNMVCWF